MIDATRAGISAYNTKSGSNFQAELRDLPSNLYVSDQNAFDLGTVTFTPDIKWTVSFYAEKPAAADRTPYFKIDIQNGSSGRSPDQLRVLLSPTDLMIETFGGGIVSAAGLSKKYPMTSSNDAAESIIKQLLGAQISSLPQEDKRSPR